MALFGRRRGPEGGVEGTALIQESEALGNVREGPSNLLDLATANMGTRNYRMKLEVSVPGREPFEVEGRFKVPRRAESTGMLASGQGVTLKPGLELPVRVDPGGGDSVEIDWGKFRSTPGRKEEQQAAHEAGRKVRIREQLEKNPELAEQMRAQNRAAAQAWAGAVRAGNMTREEFEETVQLEVDTGRMDPADAEAARSSLD